MDITLDPEDTVKIMSWLGSNIFVAFPYDRTNVLMFFKYAFIVTDWSMISCQLCTSSITQFDPGPQILLRVYIHHYRHHYFPT